MATFNKFNSFVEDVAEKVHNLGSDTLKVLLTNTALNNVGALSALEQHLIQVAPLGEARYKHIVDSYAMGAAMAIQRW